MMLIPQVDHDWAGLLFNLLAEQHTITPRGMRTTYIMNNVFVVDPRNPIILNSARDLNYRFMAAEALWMLAGDNRVNTIARYNRNISQFSDDGEVFFGAYGPKIVEQLPYVHKTLKEDKFTRQAVINIWRESPPKTKDVPCTLSFTFWYDYQDLVGSLTTHGLDLQPRLSCTVQMRSSDAFLGIPYDVFNFSMILWMVALDLGSKPGTLTMNLVNSHLYETNMEAAAECVTSYLDALELQRRSMLSHKFTHFPDERFETVDQLVDLLDSAVRCRNKADALRTLLGGAE